MRVTKVDQVRRLLTNRPDLTPKQIAARTKACVSEVYQQRLKLRAFIDGTLPKVATAKIVESEQIPVFKKQEEVKVDVTATPTYSEAFTNAVDLIAKHELNFNAGSALTAGGLAANAFVTTNTSAAAAGFTWMILGWIHRRPSVLGAATGAVVGLVAITPAAGYVPVWAAIPIGAIGSVISYYMMVWRARSSGVDESLDVFACHGMGGTWGALATGIFATTAVNASSSGLIDGNWRQVLIQIAAIAATMAYAFVVSWLLAKALKATMGLRVREEEESVGLDISQHGENAYGGI